MNWNRVWRAAWFCAVLCWGSAAFSQSKSDDLYLFDSFAAPGCEYLLNRLDNVAVEAYYKGPNSKAFLIVRGGENPIENDFHLQYLKRYLASKKLNDGRIVIFPAAGDGKLKFDFWISKSGTSKPAVDEKPISYVLPKRNGAVTFVNTSVELAKLDDKLTYVEDCGACCVESVDLDLLSKVLAANPGKTADVKLFSRKASTSSKLRKLLESDIRDEHPKMAQRVRFRYAGIDEGITHLGSNVATIDISITDRSPK